jgi:hypothetical protein
MNNVSLRDRILNAESAEEIKQLLIEGEGYQFASDATIGRWLRSATRRRIELQQKGN